MIKIIRSLIIIANLVFTIACSTTPRSSTEHTPTLTPAPAAAKISATAANGIKYDRKTWGAWADADKDCQNTRHELLIKESLEAVQLSTNGCRALTGKWRDFYTGEVITDSRELEVDHVVPIKRAHDLGGAMWDKSTKRKYYNDTDNLVLTSKKNNAQKSANDITMWQPANKERACNQAKKWVLIKRRYGLEISNTEVEYLKLLSNCDLPGL